MRFLRPFVYLCDFPAFSIHGACISAGASFSHETFLRPVPTRAVRDRRFKGVESVARLGFDTFDVSVLCVSACSSEVVIHVGMRIQGKIVRTRRWPVPTPPSDTAL